MKIYSEIPKSVEGVDPTNPKDIDDGDTDSADRTPLLRHSGLQDAFTINNITGDAGSENWVHRNVKRFIVDTGRVKDWTWMISNERAKDLNVIQSTCEHIRSYPDVGGKIKMGIYSTKYAPPRNGPDGPNYGHCIPNAFFSYLSRYTKPWKMWDWNANMGKLKNKHLPVDVYYVQGYLYSYKSWKDKEYMRWYAPMIKTIFHRGSPNHGQPMKEEIVVVVKPRIYAGDVRRWSKRDRYYYDPSNYNIDIGIWSSWLDQLQALGVNIMVTFAGVSPRSWSVAEPWWGDLCKRAENQ